MEKKKFLALSAVAVMSLSLFAGCSSMPDQTPPKKAPKVAIQDSIKKMTDVTSFKYDVGFSGNVKDVETSGKFDFRLKGGVDSKDQKNPKFDLNVTANLDGVSNGKKSNGAVDADLRLNGKTLFAKLTKVDAMEDGKSQVPEGVLSAYIGKWWSVTIPDELFDELDFSMSMSDESQMTPEQKKVKAAFEKASFFKDIKYVGNENVMGTDSAHYTVALDNDGLVAFTKEVAKINGEVVTENDLKEMKEGLSEMNFSGDLWVGLSDGFVHKFAGKVVMPEGKGTVSFDVGLGDINKGLSIDVPKDAQDATPMLMMMMGGAMGGGAPGMEMGENGMGGMNGGMPVGLDM